MALCKTITKDNGVTTTYHRITTATINQEPAHFYNDNEEKITLSARLTSYLNKEYRENDKPIESEVYHFTITLEEEESMGVRRLAYAKLKELPEWTDAEDC